MSSPRPEGGGLPPPRHEAATSSSSAGPAQPVPRPRRVGGAPTSLKDKANLVLRVRMRSTGGDWAQTQRALIEILGATKRTTVFRWVVIARDFDAEVLAYLGPRCKNKYLVGRGEEPRFKLSPKYAKIVFDLVFERMGLGINISTREFAQEFCCPLKHVETWEKAGRGELGEAHP